MWTGREDPHQLHVRRPWEEARENIQTPHKDPGLMRPGSWARYPKLYAGQRKGWVMPMCGQVHDVAPRLWLVGCPIPGPSCISVMSYSPVSFTCFSLVTHSFCHVCFPPSHHALPVLSYVHVLSPVPFSLCMYSQCTCSSSARHAKSACLIPSCVMYHSKSHWL